jgi:hypothetical protein
LYQDKKGATNCFLTEPANLNRDWKQMMQELSSF